MLWKRVIHFVTLAALIALTPSHLSAQSPAADPIAICFAPGTSEETVARAYARAPWGQVPNSLTDPIDSFQLANRWYGGATASPNDGTSDSEGDPVILTWSVVPDGTAIPGYNGEPANPSDLRAFLNGIYSGGEVQWLAVLEQIFDRWTVLTGITFIYESEDDGVTLAGSSSSGAIGVRGDVRLGGHLIDGGSGVLAYNFYPTTGDMVIDTGDTYYNNISGGSVRLRNVLAHEAGHGIGLKHVCPINQSKLMEPYVTTVFDGPQHDDIRGSNRLYGDFFEDDDTTGTAADLELLGPATTIGDLSLDDDSDIDFYAISLAAGAVLDVVVKPVGFTYLEGPQNSNGSCSTGSSFNSMSIHDLSLQILDADGSTVLASADIGVEGELEELTSIVLPNGTGFMEISGSSANDVQLYEIDLATEVLPDLLFGDGFESGDTSAWSITNP